MLEDLRHETPSDPNVTSGNPSMDTPGADSVMPADQQFGPIQFGDLDPKSPEGMEKQEKIVSDLTKMFRQWESYRLPFETLWADIYAGFLTVLRSQKVFTRARVFVPVIYQAIVAAVPKIVNIVVGQVPFFDVQPIKPEDSDIAGVIKQILNFQLFKADFYTKFVTFVTQLVMYGTSYMFVYWKTRRAWVVKRTFAQQPLSFFGLKLGKETKGTVERSYEVVECRPEVDVLDIADVYADPEATDVQDSRGFFIRTRVPLSEVKELGSGHFPVYANTDRVTETTPKNGVASPMPLVKMVRHTIRGTIASPSRTAGEDALVEVLAYWGDMDLDGDGIREEVTCIIVNQMTLLQAKPNPFDHQQRPLLKGVLFPVPFEWYGMGLIEPVLALTSELNTLRNQGLDVNNLIINRMWKVNSLADIDISTLHSVPNGVVLTDMMDGLLPLEQQELPNSVYQDGAMIQRDIENTTAPRSVQGTPESGALGRTARGAQMIITQALEKFGLAAKLTEETVVSKMLRMFHQLNQQFIPEESTWSPTGFYGPVYNDAVDPLELRSEVRFKLLGVDETISKEAKINQAISFATVFKGIPGIDFIELARYIWKLMGMDSDENKIIQSAPFPSVMNMNIPGAVPPPGSPASAGGPVAAQVAANGASVPAALPGMRSA